MQSGQKTAPPFSPTFIIYLTIALVLGTLLLPTLTLIGVTTSWIRFVVYVTYMVLMIKIGGKLLSS